MSITVYETGKDRAQRGTPYGDGQEFTLPYQAMADEWAALGWVSFERPAGALSEGNLAALPASDPSLSFATAEPAPASDPSAVHPLVEQSVPATPDVAPVTENVPA